MTTMHTGWDTFNSLMMERVEASSQTIPQRHPVTGEELDISMSTSLIPKKKSFPLSTFFSFFLAFFQHIVFVGLIRLSVTREREGGNDKGEREEERREGEERINPICTPLILHPYNLRERNHRHTRWKIYQAELFTYHLSLFSLGLFVKFDSTKSIFAM